MSRIAKKPVNVPEGVTVTIEPSRFVVEGKLGRLEQEYRAEYIAFRQEEKQVYVDRKGNSKFAKSLQGLYFRLLQNMVVGVTQGYTRQIEVVGMGYKVELRGKTVVMNIGFSHPTAYEVSPELTVELDSRNNIITLKGIDKTLIGQTAAEIRAIKPAEPYKSKGIKYVGEQIRRKAGKAAAK